MITREIKTKYDIGDRFFIVNGPSHIFEYEVSEIVVRMVYSKDEPIQKVEYFNGNNTLYHEKEMFETAGAAKDFLINSLEIEYLEGE